MPERFGDYRLVQKIAEGGMAEIFLAKRVEEFGGFEKRVALKRIFEHLTASDATVNMFLDEARIAASLNHPNIVQVFDLGRADGHFYIAMEFVHGTDVRRICRRGLERQMYPPTAMAARFVAEAAAGLHYAHTRTDGSGQPRNIVHRDVSPQNLLVSMEGHVKVCDFGIAKAENRLARTETGEFKGKLAYMSPEQFGDAEADARSDVFNLGIVLYEVALGQRLFEAPTEFELMRQVAEADVTPPSAHRSDFPSGLESIIMRALQTDPEDRFQTAEKMQLALEDWLQERGLRVGAVEISNYLEELFPELVGGPPREMNQVEFPTEQETGGTVPVTTEHVAEKERVPGAEPTRGGVASTEEVEAPEGLDAPEPRAAKGASVSVNLGSSGPEIESDASTLDEMDQETREVPVPGASRDEEESQDRATTKKETPVRKGGAETPVASEKAATQPERPGGGMEAVQADSERSEFDDGGDGDRVRPASPDPEAKSFFQRLSGWIMEPLEDEDEFSDSSTRRWALAGFGAILLLGFGLFVYLVVAQSSGGEPGSGPEISPDALSQVDTGAAPTVETVGIELRTEPSEARVVVNGTHRGKTPGTFEFAEGEKNEVYFFKKGFEPARTFVEAGAETEVDKMTLEEQGDVETAKFVVQSNPEGASVRVDGREVGQTPVELEDFPVGRHFVEMSADGHFPYTAIIDVVSGRKNAISGDLMPEKLAGTGLECDIVYDFVPQGTKVQVDGEIQGTSRMTSSGECERFVSVLGKRPNYEVVEHDVHLREPGRTALVTRLDEYERLEGELNLEVPDGVTVYLDSNERGEGDLKGVELPEGSHEIVLTGKTERFNGELTVEPEETTTYRATFQDGEWSLEKVED